MANLCNGKQRIQENVRKYDKAVVILKLISTASPNGKTVFSMPKATQ
jgi:hypothetical protein